MLRQLPISLFALLPYLFCVGGSSLRYPRYVTSYNGRIAYHHDLGFVSTDKTVPSLPGVFYCGGYNSAMDTSRKAIALDEFCRERDQEFTRFDYFGHGESDGTLEEGTVTRWRDDTFQVFGLTSGPQIIVGVSMGTWMAILLALTNPDRIKGLILIAPAVDFTTKLLFPRLSDEEIAKIEEGGVVYVDVANLVSQRKGALFQPWRAKDSKSNWTSQQIPVSQSFIKDSLPHLLLGDELGPGGLNMDCIRFYGPIRILYGLLDEVVTFPHVYRTMDMLASEDVVLTVNKYGDHRLSEPEDIQRMLKAVEELTNLV